MIDFSLISNQDVLRSSVEQLSAQSVLPRIWGHDHTVWSPEPVEITNRLGWLDIPVLMSRTPSKFLALRASLLKDGFEKIVLLGMGGSSLAPDVFRRTFGRRESYLPMEVMDTTHPDAIRAMTASLNIRKTCFIVATKSGTTVETISLFRYFYNQVMHAEGELEAGNQFIAITDPGSPLVELAERHAFRENDPNIGGRYSALSYFGLVPAAFIGVDVEELLQRTLDLREKTLPESDLLMNEAVLLGTILGTQANLGRDKLTFLSSEQLKPVGDWIEQLIAESTGKQGRGILPVVGESIGKSEDYGDDRLFIHLRWKDDNSYQKNIKALAGSGYPVLTIEIKDLLNLGAMFFLWELGTAIAGYWLGINPFDQPNVEYSKKRAKEMVTAYKEQGTLPDEKPLLEDREFAIFSGAPGIPANIGLDAEATTEGAIWSFVDSGEPNDYVSLQAYLPPSTALTDALHEFQATLRDRTGLATTFGYGPRFLHSTGQLHKGDAGKGLFIQLTDHKQARLDIPDQPGSDESTISFNTLIDAQALGDRRALLDVGRSVIRIHIKQDTVASIKSLKNAIRRDR
jgi:transaldolase/glucose-6-phosphate isomerase